MSLHNHSHHQQNYNNAFLLGISLNIAFVLVEVFFGLLADSLALLADAGHNLSDVVSLLLAWGASSLARQKPTAKWTYGFHRVTILASLISAILLLVTLGGIAWEAIERLSDPQAVNSGIIIAVAAVGVVINFATALLFLSGQKHDLNIKAAYLHMAADALVSLGVVVAGLVIWLTAWLWLDPVISLLIVLIILWLTWGLLRDASVSAIDGVPASIHLPDVAAYLQNQPGVDDLHDLHIWAIGTKNIALTVHLIMLNHAHDDQFLNQLSDGLQAKFNISHTTIQIETSVGTVCKQAHADSL